MVVMRFSIPLNHVSRLLLMFCKFEKEYNALTQVKMTDAFVPIKKRILRILLTIYTRDNITPAYLRNSELRV